MFMRQIIHKGKVFKTVSHLFIDCILFTALYALSNCVRVDWEIELHFN
jgi:hypothetical protein